MALRGIGAVCQHMSLPDQLSYGIRFLDIRCRHFGDALPIHHGRWYQQAGMTDDVVRPTVQFLRENPSEMIIMLIKYENHQPEKHALDFFQLVENALRNGGANWMGTMPETLGEGRGKIVVLNKDWPAGRTLGTNIWSFDVYDDWGKHSRSEKWKKTKARLQEVQGKSGSSICITYVSGYCNGLFGIPDTYGMRAFLNPKLNEYCKENARKGPMGIVLSDSPEKGWELSAFLSAN